MNPGVDESIETREEETPSAPSRCRGTRCTARTRCAPIANFGVSGVTMADRRELVAALGYVKAAAARADLEAGELDCRGLVGDRDGCTRGGHWAPPRPVPDRRRARWRWHGGQHERQRGHRQSRERAARRRARSVRPGAPERPRESLAIDERRLPDRPRAGDAHPRRRAARARRGARAGARGQGGRGRRGAASRTNLPAGRGAAAHRRHAPEPGTRPRPHLRRARDLPLGAARRPARSNGRRNRHRSSGGVSRDGHRAARRRDRAGCPGVA